jgi:hypothetical protein
MAPRLAQAFEGLVRRYENRAAPEDTIVFPAQKEKFTKQHRDELSDKFKQIEHRVFGKTGSRMRRRPSAASRVARGWPVTLNLLPLHRPDRELGMRSPKPCSASFPERDWGMSSFDTIRAAE